jgi:predicted nucleotide-binding protein (sugar kinase/HSP70/actin superfamily)
MNFNARKSLERAYEGLVNLGKELGASRIRIKTALQRARTKQEVYADLLVKGSNPVTLLERKIKLPINGAVKGRIGLIGHPYLVYDQYINMNVCNKLAENGYVHLFPENIPAVDIERACSRYPKKLFWSYGKNLLGGGLAMLEYGMVDGLILLTSFGCGIDSFIDELLQRANQREFQIPQTTITLDEHTGQAGFDTRLEAFIDMMEWRHRHDHYVSPHGTDVYTGQRTI